MFPQIDPESELEFYLPKRQKSLEFQGSPPSSMPAAKQAAEKVKTPSFLGTLRAEESPFSWELNKERFLASLGMAIRGTFSANCKAALTMPTLRDG